MMAEVGIDGREVTLSSILVFGQGMGTCLNQPERVARMIDAESYRNVMESAKKSYQESGDLNAAISFMKREGFSPMDAVKGVMELTGCRLQAAGQAIADSDAYPS